MLPKRTTLINYGIGDLHRAPIGEPIIDVQTARIVPRYEAIQSHQPGRAGFSRFPAIPEGMRFDVVGETNDGFRVIRNEEYGSNRAIRIHRNGVVAGGFAEPTTGRLAQARGEWPETPLFREVEDLGNHPTSFRAQLIYSGLDGTTVRAAYREFSGDFARPAFSQELQYNLNESRIIAYRSVQIEVVRATNAFIEYRVVDDGGLPWLPH